jgi:dTDP-4-amino-4,6-dideoxygalactose transaminase
VTVATRLPALTGGDPAFPNGLPLVRPTIDNPGRLARRLQTVLESGHLTNGRAVRELEDTVAERCGTTDAVAVSSCTAGLMLVYQALGVSGRVVMPSFTFSASAHAVVWAGGSPQWADVDPDTLNLDGTDVARVADGAAAISATHVYGNPCDVEALTRLAAGSGLPLVFDAAHALGSRHGGRPVGGFGTAEVFSLSPTKVAFAGEGGVVTTNDSQLAEAVRLGRDYGNPGDYDCRFIGLNARMSELHATVGSSSLEGLDERVAARNQLVRLFRDKTDGLPGLAFQRVADSDLSTYKDLTVIVDQPKFGLTVDQLAAALGAEGVDTRRYYHPPVHRQKAYAARRGDRDLPVTDAVADRVLTLPLWSHMTTTTITELARVVERIHHNSSDIRGELV